MLPKFEKKILINLNSFCPFTQSVPLDCHSFLRFTQLILSNNRNLSRLSGRAWKTFRSLPESPEKLWLSLGLQFVPAIYITRSLGLHCVNHGKEYQLNKLQSERTSCVNLGERITTPWERNSKGVKLHFKWMLNISIILSLIQKIPAICIFHLSVETNSQFVITIYFCFFLNPHVLQGFRRCNPMCNIWNKNWKYLVVLIHK